MNHSYYLLVPLVLPLAAAALLQYPFAKPTRRSIMNAALALETVFTLLAFALHSNVTLLAVPPVAVTLGSDHVSKLFSTLFAVLFCAFGAGKGDSRPTSFQAAHCLISLSLLVGLCYAGNLFTFMLFFLLLAALLLLEPKSARGEQHSPFSRLLPVSVLLIVLLTAAGSVLFALNADSTAFVNGGLLKAADRLKPALQLAAGLLLSGFLGWMVLLPPAACFRAQPRLPLVAGIMPCAGALGMLRIMYYLFGSRFFWGSTVRAALLTAVVVLAAAGGLAACRAKTLELRLALVSVSQSGCAALGLLLLHRTALWGGMLQLCAQPAAILCLLLCAAAFRNDAGRSTLSQLRGMGRQAPVLWGEFTAAALALTGLPPFFSFNALSYLVLGGWQTTAPWNWLCSAVALLSCIFPLVSLGPTVAQGIWPGKAFTPDARLYPDRRLLLAAGGLLLCMGVFGLYAGPLLQLVRSAAISIL